MAGVLSCKRAALPGGLRMCQPVGDWPSLRICMVLVLQTALGERFLTGTWVVSSTPWAQLCGSRAPISSSFFAGTCIYGFNLVLL